MTDDRVTLTERAGVAHLRLRRPDAGNAIDAAMSRAVDRALRAVERSGTARALLVTGEGKAFCVGGDVGYLHERRDRLPETVDDLTALWHGSVLPRLAALPLPVVTAAQGVVGGGALGLLWCADVVVAAENLCLVSGFARLGLTGDGGSTWYLPRLIGLRRTQQFVLQGAPVPAAQALEWGMVTRVVPRASLLAVAQREADEMARGPTWAFGRMKRLLAESADATFAEQLDAERRSMRDGATRPDARAGIAAFVARQQPRFDGA